MPHNFREFKNAVVWEGLLQRCTDVTDLQETCHTAIYEMVHTTKLVHSSVFTQQVGHVSPRVETNYSNRQSKVQAQHGGRKAAGPEHIGN
jgi:hypothetical protein